ncbi:MAG: thioredoxin domain-containing protein [Propionibacteriaceae bacterium]|jgi:protein-disulfide isomerase|nr:thioredoxin domain-containing protein [Propionibacteriaceae bacterium]
MGNARKQLAAERAAAAKRRKTIRRVVIAVVAVVVAVAAVFVVMAVVRATQNAQQTSGSVPPNANADQSGIIANPGKFAAGVPQVDIYLDYQCPYCGELERDYGDAFTQLADAGTIQLQYHVLSFLDSSLHNDSSTRAAVASACADEVGYFSAYNAAVFANQPDEGDGYSDELLTTTIPAAIGMTGDDLAKFGQCYANRQTESFVKGVQDKAYSANITGTPTVRVNGNELEYSTIVQNDPSQLGQLITDAANG